MKTVLLRIGGVVALSALATSASAIGVIPIGGGGVPGPSLTPLNPGVFNYFVEGQDVSLPTFQQTAATGAYPAGMPISYTYGTALGDSAQSASVDSPLQITATATSIENLGSLAGPLLGGVYESDFAEAQTNVAFQIQVTNPGAAPGTLVPVQIQAELQSTGALDGANNLGVMGAATGWASLNLYDNFNELRPNYYYFENCYFQGCTYPTDVVINQTIDLYANVTYTVSESVLAISAALDGVASPMTLTSTATADPHFTISQSLANQGFSFSTSRGLAPVASVAPEPAAWAVMMMGLSMIGGALRDRRGRRAAR